MIFSRRPWGLGWTLNYEMYFYLMFGLALLFPRRIGLPALVAFFTLSALAGTFIGFQSPIAYHHTSWLLMEFCLGVLVAVLVKTGVRPSAGAYAALVMVGAIALMGTILFIVASAYFGGLHFPRFVLWGIPCAILIYCSLLARNAWCETRPGRFMVRLGDASYSIYLFQLFALPALAIVIKAVGLQRFLHVDVLIALMAVGAVSVGVAVYYLIERPLSALARRVLVAPQKAVFARA